MANKKADEVERIWAIFCHLGAFAGFIFPFGNILAPLVIWLIKKNESEAVDKHGKESLNFQISLTIYMLASALLIFLVVGIFMVVALIVVGLIAVIRAVIAAGNGRFYKYPFVIRFIK